MTVFADMGDFAEDDRITAIGQAAMKGNLVGFIVEDDEKADRYVKKLRAQFPLVSVVDRMAGPVKNTILVRVRGAGH